MSAREEKKKWGGLASEQKVLSQKKKPAMINATVWVAKSDWVTKACCSINCVQRSISPHHRSGRWAGMSKPRYQQLATLAKHWLPRLLHQFPHHFAYLKHSPISRSSSEQAKKGGCIEVEWNIDLAQAHSVTENGDRFVTSTQQHFGCLCVQARVGMRWAM